MAASEFFLRALAMFFATVSPIDVAALFAILSAAAPVWQRRRMALRGTAYATALLLFFAVAGGPLLALLGITHPALQVAGGILLLLMAIDMVFARPSGMSSTTAAETDEAEAKDDIAIFPLALPLIAGPGAIGATVLLMTKAEGSLALQATVVAALLTVMAATYLLLRIADRLQALLGVTGQNVITRTAGIVLAGLAVQFIFDGTQTSGLLPTVVSITGQHPAPIGSQP